MKKINSFRHKNFCVYKSTLPIDTEISQIAFEIWIFISESIDIKFVELVAT